MLSVNSVNMCPFCTGLHCNLARMAGLRAVVDPLATGEDLASLLRAVRALPIAVPSLPNGAPTPVALYHDCVARFVGGDTAVRGDAAARAAQGEDVPL